MTLELEEESEDDSLRLRVSTARLVVRFFFVLAAEGWYGFTVQLRFRSASVLP